MGILSRLFGSKQTPGRWTADLPQLAGVSGSTQASPDGEEPHVGVSPFDAAMKDVRYLAELLETCDEDELETLITLPGLIEQIHGEGHHRLINDAKSVLQTRGQLEPYAAAEASAERMLREQVSAGFTVFGGRSPRQEVASRIVHGAHGIACALLLRPVVDEEAFRRIWAPYRFHLPFLMVYEHSWSRGE